MIYDSIENLGKYIAVCPAFKEAAEFTANLLKEESLSVGRMECSEGIYASVQEYAPKPKEEGRFEAHKEYIDIQIALAGSERLFVSALNGLKESQAYSEENDIAFYEGNEEGCVVLKPGMFAVLFPSDGHMPGIENGDSRIKKLVVKLKEKI